MQQQQKLNNCNLIQPLEIKKCNNKSGTTAAAGAE